MSIKLSDLRAYGSANMLEDNTTTGVGGAIATDTAISWIDLDTADTVKIFSSAAGDTTQTVTITGRLASGSIVSETITLVGTTGTAASTNTYERLLKAVKSGTTTGDIGIERTANTGNTTTGTAVAGSTADTINLNGTATTGTTSAVDNFYNGYVIRLTGGTGSGQIRQIVSYVGATKVATVSSAWGTTPDATTTYRISPGFYFQKSPSEVLKVRRIFYAASADVAGGASRNYYEKIFLKNDNATLALTSSQVVEFADPSGNIAFDCANAVNDTFVTTTNRLTAPPNANLSNGGTFLTTGSQNTPNNVATNQLNPGDAIGVWLQLTLAAGAAASKTSYTIELTGQST